MTIKRLSLIVPWPEDSCFNFCIVLSLHAIFFDIEHGVVDDKSLISTTYVQVLPCDPVSANTRMV